MFRPQNRLYHSLILHHVNVWRLRSIQSQLHISYHNCSLAAIDYSKLPSTSSAQHALIPILHHQLLALPNATKVSGSTQPSLFKTPSELLKSNETVPNMLTRVPNLDTYDWRSDNLPLASTKKLHRISRANAARHKSRMMANIRWFLLWYFFYIPYFLSVVIRSKLVSYLLVITV